jgi:hypothetical protein
MDSKLDRGEDFETSPLLGKENRTIPCSNRKLLGFEKRPKISRDRNLWHSEPIHY